MNATELHPAHAAALARREARLDAESKLRATVVAAAENGIRFYHSDDGTTVAYAPVGKNIFELATAILHPKDTFNRRHGNAAAAERFFAGHVIQVRKPNDEHITDMLAGLFGDISRFTMSQMGLSER